MFELFSFKVGLSWITSVALADPDQGKIRIRILSLQFKLFRYVILSKIQFLLNYFFIFNFKCHLMFK